MKYTIQKILLATVLFLAAFLIFIESVLLLKTGSRLNKSQKIIAGMQERLQNTQEELSDAQNELAEAQESLAEAQDSLAETGSKLSDSQDKLTDAQLMIEEVSKDQAGNGYIAHGALHVEGTQLSDGQNMPVVLHGMSSHGIAWYPKYLNGGGMQDLAGFGANVQRISMYSDAYGSYIGNEEENLNYLYMGIESAMSAGMYVIVDWHILEDNNPNQHSDEAVSFFNEITAHYGNHPALIYEICNEPNGDTTWDDVVRYADRVIPVIRSNAPDSVILVGTPSYCTKFEEAAKKPLTYGNIMYTFHYYVDVSQEKPCDLSKIKDAVESGLPVFVSEWGTGAEGVYDYENMHARDSIYQANAQPFIDYMAAHNLSWAAWALSNGDEKHGIFKDGCSKLSGWTQEDLTEFGKLITANLK